jgi:hypothetical protein
MEPKIKNAIEPHVCQFCKKDTIKLSWDKREQKCSCGVVYWYIPNAGTTYVPKDRQSAV